MIQLGLNLYSVRELCQTIEDFDTTMGKLAKIGYPSVQVSGIPAFDPGKIRTILDKHNLVGCAAHENLANLRENGVKPVAQRLKTLGITFTALGMPGLEDLAPEGFDRLVTDLERFAQEFAQEEITFGYHNHAVEFEIRDGAPLYAHIIERAPSLAFEPDTHWIQRGGADPSRWIRTLKGRIPAVHVKDYTSYDKNPQFAEVGHGNLYWPDIFAACRVAGVSTYIVEQDKPTPGRDILDSVAMSLKFLKENFEKL